MQESYVCLVAFDTSRDMSQYDIQQNAAKRGCVDCHFVSVILHVITVRYCYEKTGNITPLFIFFNHFGWQMG